MPSLIAFVLPLGFWGGGLAVAASAVHAVVRWRVMRSLDWAPVMASTPFAIAIVASSALNGSSPTVVLHSVGFALLVTVGLQVARALVACADAERIAIGFLLGSVVLAVSVMADFIGGWNRLPSGLFVHPNLHNWTATLLAIAFPLGLHLALRSSRNRTIGVLAAASSVVGIIATLSWVGAFALMAGLLVYGFSASRWLRWTIPAIVVATLVPYMLGWTYAGDVRGFGMQDVERSIRERLAMYEVAARLGWQRPWFGWGSYSATGGLASVEGLVEAGRALERRADADGNLLAASEDFTALAWSTWHARVGLSDAANPVGSSGVAVSTGAGVPGQRVYQYVRSTGSDDTFTLSMWIRSDHGPRTVALSVRHRDGGVDAVRELDAAQATAVDGSRAARFDIDDAWRRVSVTSHFERAPDGVLVLIYLDGYYAGDHRTEPVEVWGAQLEVGDAAGAYVRTGLASPVVRIEALTHFHNWFLQTFVQHGMPTMVALVVWLCWSVTSMRGSSAAAARAAAVGFLTAQAFDLATQQASITFAFLLVLGLGFHERGPAYLGSARTGESG